MFEFVLHVPRAGIWYDRTLATASWWDKYEIRPGDYAVQFVTIDHRPVPDGQRPYYARIEVEAVLLESYRVSRLLTEARSELLTMNRPTTVQFHPYAGVALPAWTLRGDDGVLGTIAAV